MNKGYIGVRPRPSWFRLSAWGVALFALANTVPFGRCADLGVSAEVNPPSTITNSNVVYTITIANHGPDNATRVTVTNTLPREVKYLGCDAGPIGSCGASPGVVVANFLGLGSARSVSLVITGEVGCAAADKALLTNTVVVGSAVADAVSANNQVSIVTTNSNSLKKPTCSTSIAFAESSLDHVYGIKDEDGFPEYDEFTGVRLILVATMPLEGVDITQFTGPTVFSLTLGDYLLNHQLFDDPHWKPGKTTATFREFDYNVHGKLAQDQVARLKWTPTQLTVGISMNIQNLDEASLTPVLADQYEGAPSGPIHRVVSGSLSLGSASHAFDAVYVDGAVATTNNVVVHHVGDFTLSAVVLKGAGF